MKAKQLERLMYIHVLLREGRCPSGRVLHKKLQVTLRTIYRDFYILRYRLKAPLAYDRIRRGYYYTTQNWNIFE